MPTGFKNPRIASNAWSLPKPSNAINDDTTPLTRGQVLLVDCNEGFDFIPCMPKPCSPKVVTRIPNGTWVLYLGTVEFNGATCLEFMIQDKPDELFYLGEGALPYLINIPKRKTHRGHPFRKRSGSKIGKAGKRRKPHGRRKRPGAELKKLPAPVVEDKKKAAEKD